MRVAVFGTKSYDQRFLTGAIRKKAHELVFFEERLTAKTAGIAANFEAVCAFVNDNLSALTLEHLMKGGTRLLLLRCAGFNQVGLKAAARLGIQVRRVSAYSPHAVAEFAIGMILTLNRKYHRAFNRVREGNFEIEGLLGFDLHGSTVGIVGTGKIGLLTAIPLAAMGCRILGYDLFRNPEFKALGGNVRAARTTLRRIRHHFAPLPANARVALHDQCILPAANETRRDGSCRFSFLRGTVSKSAGALSSLIQLAPDVV